MNLPITAKGSSAEVTFDGQIVAIIRPRNALVGQGEKRIPVAHITAIQLKPAKSMSGGFIQFTIGGGNEKAGSYGHQQREARRDENSVTFGWHQQAAFEALRDAIEAVQRQPSGGPVVDIGDQLAKLAELHQRGALSDAEFAAAKSRLLG